MSTTDQRIVAANIVLTLDGRYHGAGGPGDMAAIVPYASTETARNHLGTIHENATTGVLGRANAEGFLGYWSAVAVDDNADPRDRAYAKWLLDTEKVIFSTTVTEMPWEHVRVVNAPAAEVITELKSVGTGEILVNTSPTITKALLAADLIDRLYLLITPEITGGGEQLFVDGLPASHWQLTSHQVGELGELAVVYDRKH
ncbi:dihydrofolate reductase family protein [Nocardia sp. NPDC059240]|uniref:dihydrofolate reductase family protein n=1 Tax=Nocardia sp. NPDC059240 TaxID=3346786 RepID=UPI003679D0A3